MDLGLRSEGLHSGPTLRERSDRRLIVADEGIETPSVQTDDPALTPSETDEGPITYLDSTTE